MRGRLPAGAQLSPADLAHEFDVSMTPMREALIELSSEGFVTSIPARGFFVRALDSEEVREIYPIVGALESLALRMSSFSSSRIEELRLQNRRLAAESSALKKIQLDERWHRTLLQGCSNSTLLDLIETFRARTYRYGYVFLASDMAGERSVAEHDAVLDVLEIGDVDGAAQALKANWLSGPEAYLPLLEKQAQIA